MHVSFDSLIPFLRLYHTNTLAELFELYRTFSKNTSSCWLMKEDSKLDMVNLDLSFSLSC